MEQPLRVLRRVSVSTKDGLPLRAGDDGLTWRGWELHAGVELITAAQTEREKRAGMLMGEGPLAYLPSAPH